MLAKRFDERLNAGIPIREQIDVLDGGGNVPRQFTWIQADGNQEDFPRRHSRGGIERIAELALEVPTLGGGAAGETADKKVGQFDGTLDGARPILAGKQLGFIHPGLEAGLLHSCKEFASFGAILLGVGEENATAAVRLENDFVIFVELKTSHAINLDRSAFM
jgi:hypothetical protein